MDANEMILIIDAEHSVAELIAEVLSDEGYNVYTAHDKDDTLTFLSTHLPRLVLVDSAQAQLSATNLLDSIYSRYQASVPVVTMTTNTAMGDALVARDRHACLMKPFTLDALLGCIAHYVQPSPNAALS